MIAVAVLVTLLAGCSQGDPEFRASPIGSVPTQAPTTLTTTLTTVPAALPTLPALVSFIPERIRVRRLQVDAPVVSVSILPAGDLDVPANPDVIGWWAEGARPGDATGSVVLDGHVDSAQRGLGAFAALRSAQVGDMVEVVGTGGENRAYTVVARRVYPKSSLPAAEVFSQDVAERLVLVTCGGRFDRATGHYDDNIVVYAAPTV